MNKINKLFRFSLLALLVAGIGLMVRPVQAENSAASYDNKYYSQQVFSVFYNQDVATIPNNAPVILAVPQTINPNVSMGQYMDLTATTDSIFTIGVTDEAVAPGSLGRVCVRGPHKVVFVNSQAVASGTILATTTTPGKAGPYSSSDGTTGARLGYILSGTASTDTGDASNTYWAWIAPNIHK